MFTERLVLRVFPGMLMPFTGWRQKMARDTLCVEKGMNEEKREVVQEAKLLEALSHPNIVQFIEVFKTKKGKLCIIMDFADGK